MKVRVAFGTGAMLGLWHGRLEVFPTTAHFLLYHDGRCRADCKFCPQAKGSTSDLRMLSRVMWPVYEFERVLQKLSLTPEWFRRICIQSVNYPGSMDDLYELIERIKDVSRAPLSVSTHPLTGIEARELKSLGVERLCVPLDACTAEIFSEIKGGYEWVAHWDALERATKIFGGATTHLIIGLGESEEEAAGTIQTLTDMGVTVGLFAFTPIRGTPLENRNPPEIRIYRRVQVAHYLIQRKKSRAEKMKFENGELTHFGIDWKWVLEAAASGEPFRTSGCPGCNRPFYNESPRGPIYNYPRKPNQKEISEIKAELGFS